MGGFIIRVEIEYELGKDKFRRMILDIKMMQDNINSNKNNIFSIGIFIQSKLIMNKKENM